VPLVYGCPIDTAAAFGLVQYQEGGIQTTIAQLHYPLFEKHVHVENLYISLGRFAEVDHETDLNTSPAHGEDRKRHLLGSSLVILNPVGLFIGFLPFRLMHEDPLLRLAVATELGFRKPKKGSEQREICRSRELSCGQSRFLSVCVNGCGASLNPSISDTEAELVFGCLGCMLIHLQIIELRR
jgi:hypothetical protein